MVAVLEEEVEEMGIERPSTVVPAVVQALRLLAFRCSCRNRLCRLLVEWVAEEARQCPPHHHPLSRWQAIILGRTPLREPLRLLQQRDPQGR